MENLLSLLAVIIGNDLPKQSDAIILLEGDYYNRIAETARLFKNGLGKFVVISGGVDDKEAGKIHAKYLKQNLIKEGVLEEQIILEDLSQNTRDQAVAVMGLAKKKQWQKIILVASHYHQLRAFLTFLKAMQESGLNLGIFNSPAKDLSWFEKDPKESRLDLLRGELERIDKYKNHVASFDEAISYLKLREEKFNNYGL